MKNQPEIPQNMPLTEQTFYILLSLHAGPRHGYAILKDIEQLSQGRLLISVSTLYTALKRMLEQKLIERLESDREDQGGRPRKRYQLTPDGRRILATETQRLKDLVQAANQRLSEGTL
jgi:DNA-binding PadR family transcriptional regulator